MFFCNDAPKDAVEADLKLSTISFNAAIAACDKGPLL